MDEERAIARCAELAAEHPDRDTHQWIPRERDGDWQVVKVPLPPPNDMLTGTQAAEERPATPDDVRDSHSRNSGGPWVGGV